MKDYPALNIGLEENTKNKGYNNRIYTLYELRASANNYQTSDDKKCREVLKMKHEKVYNCLHEIVPQDILEKVYGLSLNFIEVWRKDNSYKNFEILASNLGRIKKDGKIVIQKNHSLDGYLKCDSPAHEVYKIVARAFFGDTEGFHIHHINNNGFDCRPENLILLTQEEHSKAHGWPIGKSEE